MYTINNVAARFAAQLNRLSLLLVVIALLAGAGTARAQVLYGSLTGFVTDPTRASVPGAHVEVLNTSTGISRPTVTDERGGYLVQDLQPGRYKVTVSAVSFTTVIHEAVVVEANSVRRLDAQLSVAQVSESVTVSTATAMLQTDRADVSQEIQSTQVTSLPVTGQRNYQSLFALLPGVTPPTSSKSTAVNPQNALVISVNGMGMYTNNARLDGATINSLGTASIVAYIPPTEAIETVNVVTNSFDAEQGTAGGAAINVFIKSGTNNYHGTGWWYNSDSALRARNFFYAGSQVPKDIMNQAGVALGGPIRKNKLFFFGDWERTRRRQNVSGFQTIAYAALQRGDFSGTGAAIYDPLTGNLNGTGRQLFPGGIIPSSRFDPASVKMAALLPNPNQSTFPNNYFASGPLAYDLDDVDFKVNYNPADRLSIFGRYSFAPHRIYDPPALGLAGGSALGTAAQPGLGTGLTQSAATGVTYTVTARLLIDGHVGYTRQYLTDQDIDIGTNYGLNVLNIPGTNGPDHLQGGYPAFIISSFSSLGNPSAANPLLRRDNQWVGSTNVGWTKGAHSLRFGFETMRLDLNHFQPQIGYGPRGGFTFTGGLTSLNGGAAPTLYNGWADFLLGLPQSMGKDTAVNNPNTLRMRSFALYGSDHWQVSRKLTLSYGIRWERFPFPTRGRRGAERYDPFLDLVLIGGVGEVPHDAGVNVGFGQFAPRLGLAWRSTDKMVLRVGYGVSTDPTNFRFMQENYPDIITNNLSGNSSFQAAGSLRTGIPAIAVPDLGDGYITLPLNISMRTVPETFDRGYIQSFNFTLQRELAAGFTAQAGYIGTRATRTIIEDTCLNAAGPGGGNAGRALAPRTGDITEFLPLTPTTYDSLQMQLTRRTSANTQFGAAYTFSKSINYGSESGTGGGGLTLRDNWLPALSLNKGLSDSDRTHNLHLWGIASLPFGSGQRWVKTGPAARILGGWQLNATLAVMSGLPFTVTSSATSLNAPDNSQTADQVLATVRTLGAVGPGTTYFDPNAFAPVTTVRFGTSGRNILRGPGLVQSDLSLFRTIAMGERIRVQFRAEAFNFTNTPAFNNPASNVSSATRNADGSIRALNGYASVTTAMDTSRLIRLGLRLSF